MAKKKTTRKELLKGPDEFLTLSGRAFEFLNARRRQINYVLLGLGALAVVYLGVNTYLRHVNQRGQEAYNKAYQALREKRPSDPAAEEWKDLEAQFRKVIEDYSLSKASRLALPQLGYIRFREGRNDEAIAEYRKFLAEVGDEVQYGSLARLALAACYEVKGEYKTAADILNLILQGSTEVFKEDALWSLARIYRLDNQPEKATETLKQFVEKYPASPFLDMAKARL